MSKEIVSQNIPETKKSKLLRRYEVLLQDIETRKKYHENLNEGLRTAIPKIQAELRPLAQIELEWEIKQIVRLDEIYEEIVLPKLKSEFFVDCMIEQLEKQLSEAQNENARLHSLYSKYARREFQRDRAKHEYLAELIKTETGFDVDLEEMKSKGFEKYIAENQEKWGIYKPNLKKKSKKKVKNEQLEREEHEILATDAKAIYFRLIKKYHPDLQRDSEKQLEFTEISKRVTKAYKENDFMALLLLQIEYLDDNDLDASLLADDMLKRYTKILQAQLTTINKTLEMVKISSQGMFEHFFDKDYQFSEKLFELKKKEITNNIELLKTEIEKSHEQKKGWLKTWLNVQKELKEAKVARFEF